MGWITAMEAREDGIWGKVEWNAEGSKLVTGRSYRNLSPVVRHDARNTILAIANVSLVNRPNLRGLTALNQESDMTLLERLAELLGLDATSSETEVFNAVSAMKGSKGGDATALQSQMSEIGIALGLGTGGDATSILEAAKKAKSGGADMAARWALCRTCWWCRRRWKVRRWKFSILNATRRAQPTSGRAQPNPSLFRGWHEGLSDGKTQT